MIFKIFLIGFVFLIYAIGLNLVAQFLKVMSWYDFLAQPKQVTALSLLWLFVLYPFLLGLFVYFAKKYIP